MDMDSDNFKKEVVRIAQAISFGQDVSSEDPNLVIAARLYLEYREEADAAPPTERTIKLPSDNG